MITSSTYDVSQTLTYECNPGYATREDTVTECLATFTWSLDTMLPTCTKSMLFVENE